jgi:hypothetical protein
MPDEELPGLYDDEEWPTHYGEPGDDDDRRRDWFWRALGLAALLAVGVLISRVWPW